MKIFIGSSQRNEIDDKYKDSARKICDYLASDNNDLIWGFGSDSIMGITYESFDKQNRNIMGVTNPKYTYLKEYLSHAKYEEVEDTFIMKKRLMDLCDMLIMLPGGVGSISEFFAYLEEIRSNDSTKPLIVFDEHHHYDKAFELIDDLIDRKFNDKSIYSYFYIARSMDEFIKIYTSIKEK